MIPNENTTPWPEELPLRAEQTVYDLVYNPAETRLLQQAKQMGAHAIGGLGMLIWQGALAFERWTNLPAPVGGMRAAAEEHMRQRAGETAQHHAEHPIHVRRAVTQDAVEISRLHNALQAVHAAALPDFFKPPSDNTFPPSTVRDLLVHPATVIFLAEVDGVAVGYLYADTMSAQETSMTYRLERLWIHHIGVEPDHRQRGVGKALIAAAKQYARANAIQTVALSVWAFNRPAIRFFTVHGFEAYNHRMWLQLSNDTEQQNIAN